MDETLQTILSAISNSLDDMIDLQRRLTAVPALSPESGGEGEMKKALELASWLREKGFPEPEWYFAPDDRAAEGKRPSLVVTLPGRSDKRNFWIMSHLDVVPPGEEGLWKSDPFTLKVESDRLIGRGVEDNQQGMVCSIFAVKALLEAGIMPADTVKLLFVADEENGSVYGIQYLLAKENLFGARDYVLVPDGGDPEGATLEIAEKSTLWLKFCVSGKQCHASRPDQGVNAFVAGSALVCALEKLKDLYPQQNSLFDPPGSTFVPTKKEANVPNINTLPGEDVFYLDSRILPEIPLAEVFRSMDEIQERIEKHYGVTIRRSEVQRTESKATPEDSGFLEVMKKVILQEYGIQARPVGIGGGTVGAYLRNYDLETVVWSRIDETAHMPNEYCKIDNLLGDCRIMARLMLQGYPGIPEERKQPSPG
ncbi:MAG: M20 family metallo-hydrolase [Spirochaetales bacterium]|nr:M20 family metallo-hydrolase [Spirochaetales bacterium]